MLLSAMGLGLKISKNYSCHCDMISHTEFACEFDSCAIPFVRRSTIESIIPERHSIV